MNTAPALPRRTRPAVFEVLCVRHHPSLCALASSFVREPAGVEDIVQGVYASLLERVDRQGWAHLFAEHRARARGGPGPPRGPDRRPDGGCVRPATAGEPDPTVGGGVRPAPAGGPDPTPHGHDVRPAPLDERPAPPDPGREDARIEAAIHDPRSPESRRVFGLLRAKVVCAALHHLRDLIRSREQQMDDDAPDPPDPASGPLKALCRHDEAQRVRLVLALLPERHGRILALYYLGQSTVEEIAERWEIPVNSVGPRLTRARRAFAEMWRLFEAEDVARAAA